MSNEYEGLIARTARIRALAAEIAEDAADAADKGAAMGSPTEDPFRRAAEAAARIAADMEALHAKAQAGVIA